MHLPACEALRTNAHWMRFWRQHVNQKSHIASTKLHYHDSPLLTQMSLSLLNMQNIYIPSVWFPGKNICITLEIRISSHFSGNFREKARFSFWHSSSCIYFSDGIVYTVTWRRERDKIDEHILLQDCISIQNKPKECISLEHFIQDLPTSAIRLKRRGS